MRGTDTAMSDPDHPDHVPSASPAPQPQSGRPCLVEPEGVNAGSADAGRQPDGDQDVRSGGSADSAPAEVPGDPSRPQTGEELLGSPDARPGSPGQYQGEPGQDTGSQS